MGATVHEALQRATPGTAIIYHTGANLKGCRHTAKVRQLYDAGLAELVQARVPEGFAYIVQFRYVRAKVAGYTTFRDAGLLRDVRGVLEHHQKCCVHRTLS